jgi:hypothetical protein
VGAAALHSTTILRILQVLVDLVEEHQVERSLQAVDLEAVAVMEEVLQEPELLDKGTQVHLEYGLGIQEVEEELEELVALILLMAALEY